MFNTRKAIADPATSARPWRAFLACTLVAFFSPCAVSADQENFIAVGPGSCLDGRGLRPQRHYKMGGVSASECRGVCVSSIHCSAYSHRTTDGYCSVFGTGMEKAKVPSGWLHWPGTGTDDVVRGTGGANTRMCYRKDIRPASAGTTVATATT